MAEALEPATTGANGVAFELDRIELAGGDRLEVNGRWFGVRGRRFIRPSLTLVADEEQRRLLADLDHKPWAAEDGQPWQATFPYDRAGRPVDRGGAQRRPGYHRDAAAAGRLSGPPRPPAERFGRGFANSPAKPCAVGRAGQGPPRDPPAPARARTPRRRGHRAIRRAQAARCQARGGVGRPRGGARRARADRRRTGTADAGARRGAGSARCGRGRARQRPALAGRGSAAA